MLLNFVVIPKRQANDRARLLNLLALEKNQEGAVKRNPIQWQRT